MWPSRDTSSRPSYHLVSSGSSEQEPKSATQIPEAETDFSPPSRLSHSTSNIYRISFCILLCLCLLEGLGIAYLFQHPRHDQAWVNTPVPPGAWFKDYYKTDSFNTDDNLQPHGHLGPLLEVLPWPTSEAARTLKQPGATTVCPQEKNPHVNQSNSNRDNGICSYTQPARLLLDSEQKRNNWNPKHLYA